MNAKRDEQKQKSDEKRTQETLDERKKKIMFFTREFFLIKKTEDFFGNCKRDKRNKRSLCSQKMLGLNGREWKKKKKERSFLENFAKENGKMSSPICCIKKQLFSARHNKIVKNVKNGETIFSRFFEFFSITFLFPFLFLYLLFFVLLYLILLYFLRFLFLAIHLAFLALHHLFFVSFAFLLFLLFVHLLFLELILSRFGNSLCILICHFFLYLSSGKNVL